MEELEHLSNKQIDDYVAELGSELQRTNVGTHTGECEPCASRLDEAKEARDTFLRDNPPRMRAEELLDAASKTRLLTWWAPAALGVAAVAALLFVLPGVFGGPENDDIRFKGGPSISYLVLRAGDNKPVAGTEGDRFSAGDSIQIKVAPADRPFVSVIFIDNEGKITHLLTMKTEKTTALPNSLVVDDSPHSERIFVLFSKAAVSQPVIREAAGEAFSRAGSIDAMDSFAIDAPDAVVRSLWVRKKEPE